MGISFTNLTVFILFFGIALIEATQMGHWLEAALFAGLGLLSLGADLWGQSKGRRTVPREDL
jgi:hypothetical protein